MSEVTSDSARTGLAARLTAGLFAAPSYTAQAADRRTVRVAGLELPFRATVAVLVATLIVALDWSRTFIPREILDLNRAAEAMRFQAWVRVGLYGALPLAVVYGVFRDRPSRYGLRLGDWRPGLGLAAAGCVVMTPLALAIGSLPDFREYYAPSAAPLGELALTHAIELFPAEFLFRGFLMFTLLRAIGPLGIVVAQVPFVFGHLSKPELELLSTFFGGLAYGWLDWRTGSILWSALAHIWILTALIAAAGAG